MFCEKCGKEIDPNGKFCDGCGAPIKGNNAADGQINQNQSVTQNQVNAETAVNQNPTVAKPHKKPMSSKTKIIIGAAAGGAVLVIALLVIILSMPKKIHLDEYINVTFSGMNEKGTATATIDSTNLLSAVNEANSKAITDIKFLFSGNSFVSYKLDKSAGLSNGDTVTLTVKVNEDALKQYGIKFVGGNKEYEVKDLSDGTTINLLDYLTVEFSGMDTKGTAEIKYDNEKLRTDLTNAAQGTIQNLQYRNITSFADVSIDKRSELSNGDEVTLSAKCQDENELNYCCIVLEGGEKKISVKDLDEGKKIDVFKDLEIKFSGISGDGELEMENKSKDKFIKSVYFSSDSNYNLSNGDKITITASYSDNNAVENGYIIQNDTKEITVEGLGEYIDSPDKISDSDLSAIKTKANDIANLYFAEAYSYSAYINDIGYLSSADSISNLKLNSCHLLYKDSKNCGYGDKHNSLILVYTFDVNGLDEKSYTSVYGAVFANNLVIDADGKIDLSDNDTFDYSQTCYSTYADFEKETLTVPKTKDGYTVYDVTIK